MGFIGTVNVQVQSDQQEQIHAMKTLYVICVGIMLLGPALQPDAANVYTWTDKDGVVHITDQPPPAGAEVVDVIPYQKQAPAQTEEIDRRQQELREQVIRDDQRREAEAARRRAREAEKRAQEAVERANRKTQYTNETIQNLPGSKYRYKALYGHTRRMLQESEEAQAQAKQAVEEARRAAEEAQAAEENIQPIPSAESAQ